MLMRGWAACRGVECPRVRSGFSEVCWQGSSRSYRRLRRAGRSEGLGAEDFFDPVKPGGSVGVVGELEHPCRGGCVTERRPVPWEEIGFGLDHVESVCRTMKSYPDARVVVGDFTGRGFGGVV